MCYVNPSAASNAGMDICQRLRPVCVYLPAQQQAGAQASQLLPLVTDMRSESRNPVQDGKDSEVFLEDRVHFRAIDNSLTLLLVGHFLLRE